MKQRFLLVVMILAVLFGVWGLGHQQTGSAQENGILTEAIEEIQTQLLQIRQDLKDTSNRAIQQLKDPINNALQPGAEAAIFAARTEALLVEFCGKSAADVALQKLAKANIDQLIDDLAAISSDSVFIGASPYLLSQLSLNAAGIDLTFALDSVCQFSPEANPDLFPSPDDEGVQTVESTLSNKFDVVDQSLVVAWGSFPTAPSFVIDVLADDRDENVTGDVLNGDELFIKETTIPNMGGTVAISPDKKTLTYTPLQGFNGVEIFEYKVCDTTVIRGVPNPLCDTAEVTIRINANNRPPVSTNDEYGNILEDTTFIVDLASGVLNNDNDINLDNFIVVDVRNTANFNFIQRLNAPQSLPPDICCATETVEGGFVLMRKDGGFTYEPSPNFSGEDEFWYEIQDDFGGSSISRVRLTVQPVNDPPVTRFDFFQVTETVIGTATSAFLTSPSSVLVNDSDPVEGDMVTAVPSSFVVGTQPLPLTAPFSFTSAKGASVIMAADGTFTYDLPDTTLFFGTSLNPAPLIDTFQYKACDEGTLDLGVFVVIGDPACTFSTVEITVNPVPRADLSIQILKGETLTQSGDNTACTTGTTDAIAGCKFFWEIQVNNIAGATTDNVRVALFSPFNSQFRFVGCSTEVTCDASGTTNPTFVVGNLIGGQSKTFKVLLRLDPAYVRNSGFNPLSSPNFRTFNDNTLSNPPIFDPIRGNDDTVSTPPVQINTIAVANLVFPTTNNPLVSNLSPLQAIAGEPSNGGTRMGWTAKVQNLGPSVSAGVALCVQLVASVSFDSAPNATCPSSVSGFMLGDIEVNDAAFGVLSFGFTDDLEAISINTKVDANYRLDVGTKINGLRFTINTSTPQPANGDSNCGVPRDCLITGSGGTGEVGTINVLGRSLLGVNNARIENSLQLSQGAFRSGDKWAVGLRDRVLYTLQNFGPSAAEDATAHVQYGGVGDIFLDPEGDNLGVLFHLGNIRHTGSPEIERAAAQRRMDKTFNSPNDTFTVTVTPDASTPPLSGQHLAFNRGVTVDMVTNLDFRRTTEITNETITLPSGDILTNVRATIDIDNGISFGIEGSPTDALGHDVIVFAQVNGTSTPIAIAGVIVGGNGSAFSQCGQFNITGGNLPPFDVTQLLGGCVGGFFDVVQQNTLGFTFTILGDLRNTEFEFAVKLYLSPSSSSSIFDFSSQFNRGGTETLVLRCFGLVPGTSNYNCTIIVATALPTSDELVSTGSAQPILTLHPDEMPEAEPLPPLAEPDEGESDPAETGSIQSSENDSENEDDSTAEQVEESEPEASPEMDEALQADTTTEQKTKVNSIYIPFVISPNTSLIVFESKTILIPQLQTSQAATLPQNNLASQFNSTLVFSQSPLSRQQSPIDSRIETAQIIEVELQPTSTLVQHNPLDQPRSQQDWNQWLRTVLNDEPAISTDERGPASTTLSYDPAPPATVCDVALSDFRAGQSKIDQALNDLIAELDNQSNLMEMELGAGFSGVLDMLTVVRDLFKTVRDNLGAFSSALPDIDRVLSSLSNVEAEVLEALDNLASLRTNLFGLDPLTLADTTQVERLSSDIDQFVQNLTDAINALDETLRLFDEARARPSVSLNRETGFSNAPLLIGWGPQSAFLGGNSLRPDANALVDWLEPDNTQDTIQVRVGVRNTGLGPLQNVQLELSGLNGTGPDGFPINSGNLIQTLPSLEPGETGVVNFETGIAYRAFAGEITANATSAGQPLDTVGKTINRCDSPYRQVDLTQIALGLSPRASTIKAFPFVPVNGIGDEEHLWRIYSSEDDVPFTALPKYPSLGEMVSDVQNGTSQFEIFCRKPVAYQWRTQEAQPLDPNVRNLDGETTKRFTSSFDGGVHIVATRATMDQLISVSGDVNVTAVVPLSTDKAEHVVIPKPSVRVDRISVGARGNSLEGWSAKQLLPSNFSLDQPINMDISPRVVNIDILGLGDIPAAQELLNAPETPVQLSIDGNDLGTQNVGNIPLVPVVADGGQPRTDSDQFASATFQWSGQEGEHQLEAQVDPENTLVELLEDDNTTLLNCQSYWNLERATNVGNRFIQFGPAAAVLRETENGTILSARQQPGNGYLLAVEAALAFVPKGGLGLDQVCAIALRNIWDFGDGSDSLNLPGFQSDASALGSLGATLRLSIRHFYQEGAFRPTLTAFLGEGQSKAVFTARGDSIESTTRPVVVEIQPSAVGVFLSGLSLLPKYTNKIKALIAWNGNQPRSAVFNANWINSRQEITDLGTLNTLNTNAPVSYDMTKLNLSSGEIHNLLTLNLRAFDPDKNQEVDDIDTYRGRPEAFEFVAGKPGPEFFNNPLASAIDNDEVGSQINDLEIATLAQATSALGAAFGSEGDADEAQLAVKQELSKVLKGEQDLPFEDTVTHVATEAAEQLTERIQAAFANASEEDLANPEEFKRRLDQALQNTKITIPAMAEQDNGLTTDATSQTPPSLRSATVALQTMPTITLAGAGVGSGAVALVPAASLNCNLDAGVATGTCQQSYSDGSTLTLIASVNPNSDFSSWTGCDTINGTQCMLTLNGNRTVTATFSLKNRTLTVDGSGDGEGTVTSNNINCMITTTMMPAGVCMDTLSDGDAVSLTATANTGSVFSGWSGACTGNGVAQITMDASKTCTATFALQTSNQSNLSVSVEGMGTVTSNMGQINCPGTCAQGFGTGATVILTATPDFGATFVRWNRCSNPTGATCTLTLNSPQMVKAIFNSPQFPLNVITGGRGSGTVTSDLTGIICGSDCMETFANSIDVKLIAVAAKGSSFSGWNGCLESSPVVVTKPDGRKIVTKSTCVVKMTTTKNVTANFDLQKVTAEIEVDDGARQGRGEVTSSNGISCRRKDNAPSGQKCTADFDFGTTIILNIKPSPGSLIGTKPVELKITNVLGQLITATTPCEQVAVGETSNLVCRITLSGDSKIKVIFDLSGAVPSPGDQGGIDEDIRKRKRMAKSTLNAAEKAAIKAQIKFNSDQTGDNFAELTLALERFQEAKIALAEIDIEIALNNIETAVKKLDKLNNNPNASPEEKAAARKRLEEAQSDELKNLAIIATAQEAIARQEVEVTERQLNGNPADPDDNGAVGEVARLENELMGLNNENPPGRLQENEITLQQKQGDLTGLQVQLDAAQMRLDNANRIIDDPNASPEAKQQAENERFTAISDIDTLDNQIRLAEQAVSNAQQDVDIIRTAADERAQELADAKTTELATRENLAEAQRQEQEAKRIQAETELDQARKQKIESDNEFRQAERDLQEAQRKQQSAQEESNTAGVRVMDLQMQVDELTRQLADFEMNNATQVEIDQVQQQLDVANADLQMAQQQQGDAEVAANSAIAEAGEAEAKKAEAEAKKEAAENAIGDAQEKILDADIELENIFDDKNQVIDDQTDAAEEKLDNSQRDLDDAQMRQQQAMTDETDAQTRQQQALDDIANAQNRQVIADASIVDAQMRQEQAMTDEADAGNRQGEAQNDIADAQMRQEQALDDIANAQNRQVIADASIADAQTRQGEAQNDIADAQNVLNDPMATDEQKAQAQTNLDEANERLVQAMTDEADAQTRQQQAQDDQVTAQQSMNEANQELAVNNAKKEINDQQQNEFMHRQTKENAQQERQEQEEMKATAENNVVDAEMQQQEANQKRQAAEEKILESKAVLTDINSTEAEREKARRDIETAEQEIEAATNQLDQAERQRGESQNMVDDTNTMIGNNNTDIDNANNLINQAREQQESANQRRQDAGDDDTGQKRAPSFGIGVSFTAEFDSKAKSWIFAAEVSIGGGRDAANSTTQKDVKTARGSDLGGGKNQKRKVGVEISIGGSFSWDTAGKSGDVGGFFGIAFDVPVSARPQASVNVSFQFSLAQLLAGKFKKDGTSLTFTVSVTPTVEVPIPNPLGLPISAIISGPLSYSVTVEYEKGFPFKRGKERKKEDAMSFDLEVWGVLNLGIFKGGPFGGGGMTFTYFPKAAFKCARGVAGVRIVMDLGLFSATTEVKRTWKYGSCSPLSNILIEEETGLVIDEDRSFAGPDYATFLNQSQGISAFGVEEIRLIENAFPNSNPQLASDGEQFLLVWVQEDLNKPMLQSRELWYAMAGPDLNFSEPQRLTSNFVPDASPRLSVDANGNFVLLWIQNKDPQMMKRLNTNNLNSELQGMSKLEFTTDASSSLGDAPQTQTSTSVVTLLDALAKQELVYATFDPTNSTWSETQWLTDNESLDEDPHLVQDEAGNMKAIWARNDSNLPYPLNLVPAPATLYSAKWSPDTKSFDPQQMLREDDAAIERSFAYRDGKLLYTWVEDQQAFSAFYENGILSPIQKLSKMDSNAPAAAFTPTGVPIALWLEKQETRNEDQTGTLDSELMEARFENDEWVMDPLPLEGVSINGYELVQDADGNLALLWSQLSDTQGRGIDAFALIYDHHMGGWTDKKQLTDDTDLEENFSAVLLGQNIFMAYMKQALTIEAETMTYSGRDAEDPTIMYENEEFLIPNMPHFGASHLQVLRAGLVSDLLIPTDTITLSPAIPAPGDAVEITVPIRNVGRMGVEGESIVVELRESLDGKVVDRQVLSALNVDATDQVTFSWIVPNELTEQILFAVVDPDHQISESFEDNNIAMIPVLTHDYEIENFRFVFRPKGMNTVEIEEMASTESDEMIESMLMADPNQEVVIQVTVNNEGLVPAPESVVNFAYALDSNVHTQQMPLGDILLPALMPGETSTVEFVWDVTDLQEDAYRVFGVVTSTSNSNPEVNRGNNEFFFVAERQPDLTVATSVNVEGQLQVTVTNNGATDAISVDLMVFEMNNVQEIGTSLLESIIDVVPAFGGEVSLIFDLPDTNAPELFVVVDSEDTIVETNESNNTAMVMLQDE